MTRRLASAAPHARLSVPDPFLRMRAPWLAQATVRARHGTGGATALCDGLSRPERCRSAPPASRAQPASLAAVWIYKKVPSPEPPSPKRDDDDDGSAAALTP